MTGGVLHPTVTVNDVEAKGVALRMCARLLATEWMEWEDVAWFSEDSFDRVELAARQVAEDLLTLSRAHDLAHDVDSGDILSRAQA